MKKILASAIVVSAMTALLVTAVSAGTISGSGSSFSSAWERYTTGDSGKASLTYGYNTFLIKEDYAWANHSTSNHYASLSNANGSFSGPNKSSGALSKIEVTHNGSSVYYYCHY